MLPRYFIKVLVAVLFCSCASSPGGEEIYEGLDRATANKMKQYYVEGKRLYQTHCQNCHQEIGTGLGLLIPPLAKADYIETNYEFLPCIIKNGLQGEVIVNGKNYNQVMLAHDELTALEIAEILTYVTNSWGNKKGLLDSKAVKKALNSCSE